MTADSDGITLSSDMLVFFLLFLGAVDFLDFSGILIALAIVLFLFLRISELQFDADAAILVLFSAFYFGSVAFYEGMAVDTVIKFAIAPWGCYVLSYNMRLRNRAISVTAFSGIIVFGFFVHGMLNLSASIKVFGSSLVNNYRCAYDFWQSRVISVTTASLYYTPYTVLAIGSLFFSGSLLVRLISPVCIVLALYASLLYQNRTLIAICALVGAMDVLLLTVDPDMPAEKKRRVYAVLTAGILLVVIAFVANIGGLQDAIMGSSLMNRMSGEKQDRTTIWFSFLFGEAWKYPFGGSKAVLYANRSFVHNTWLDTFRRAGFIPFLLLIIFTVRSVFNTLEFNRLGKLTGEDTCVILSLLAGTMLSFMVEPVIEGNPYVFYIPLLVMGAVNGHNRDVQTVLEDYYALYYQ